MIYALTGENGYLIDQQVKQLVGEFEGTAERFDGGSLSLQQLPDLFTGATLFANQRLLILKDVSANKTVWADLGDWLEKVGDDTTVILVEQAPDKRTKTFKWLQKNATVRTSDYLRPGDAVSWVQTEARTQNLDLDRTVAQYLVDYIGVDQWQLGSEVGKLVLSGKPVTVELIRELVEPTPQASAFELLDAVFRGDGKDVERLISQLERAEDPYRFFGLLSTQLLAVVAVGAGAGKPPDAIASTVGVHPYVIRKSVPLARRLSKRTQNLFVERLAELDYNLKSRSVEPWLQIRTALGAMQTQIK